MYLSTICCAGLFTFIALHASDVSQLTFAELKAAPLSDAAAQTRLAELGDPEVIRICLEQLVSEDPALVESAVLVLSAARRAELLAFVGPAFHRLAALQKPRAIDAMERTLAAILRSAAGLPTDVQQWAASLPGMNVAQRRATLTAFLSENLDALRAGRLNDLTVPR